MEKLKYLIAVIALSAAIGCNRNSDSTGGSTDNQTSSSGSGRSANESRSYLNNTNQTSDVKSAEPDNSGKNVRDRSDATLTPGDQSGSDSDREITRKIRRAITSNDQLSTDAKNIKIITINGKVTLRGPVKTADEQKTINSIVQQQGVTSVDDQLEVKATQQ